MNWSNAIWAGVAGGVAMEFAAILLHMIGFSRSSMVSYEGCMLTGKHSGAGSYMAGIAMHLALSVLIAFAYTWAFAAFWGQGGRSYGLMLAVPHWAAGGLVVPLMDRFSGCVQRRLVELLKLFASRSHFDRLVIIESAR